MTLLSHSVQSLMIWGFMYLKTTLIWGKWVIFQKIQSYLSIHIFYVIYQDFFNVENNAYWQKLFRYELRLQETPGNHFQVCPTLCQSPPSPILCQSTSPPPYSILCQSPKPNLVSVYVSPLPKCCHSTPPPPNLDTLHHRKWILSLHLNLVSVYIK